MGTDVCVQVFHGYKMKLSTAFELGIISASILDGDDWQLLSEEEYRDEMIKTHVTSRALFNLLTDSKWNLYILAPQENDYDPGKSYLFLYYKREKLTGQTGM